MSKRRALERMLAAGKASIERDLVQAAREARQNEPVRCFMCGETVPRKATVKLPPGPACKRHPGVS